MNYEAYRKLFLWRGRGAGYRLAGGYGLLPLQFVPVVVRWTRERFHAVEAGSGADYVGCAKRRDVREDADEPAQILREMRRALDDQSSNARTRRCLCRNAPDARF